MVCPNLRRAPVSRDGRGPRVCGGGPEADPSGITRESRCPGARRRECAVAGARGGFSLIEVLTVLVISGILVALAAPSFTRWVQGSRLDGAMAQIASDIAYARMLAVRSSTPATISFAESEYIIAQPGGATPLKRTRVTQQYPGLTVSATPSDVEFDSRGLMRGTSAVVRATEASSGRQLELRINAAGRVRRVY